MNTHDENPYDVAREAESNREEIFPEASARREAAEGADMPDEDARQRQIADRQREGLLSRVRQISQETGCSLTRIEQSIGVSSGVIRRAMLHNRDFAARNLTAIIEKFPQYSGDWLLVGREPKLISDDSNGGLDEVQLRQKLEKALRALDEERRRRIKAEADLADLQSRELAPDMIRMRLTPDEATEQSGVSIPFYDIEASAGLGLPTHEGGSRPSEKISIPFAREGDLALTVGGVSMTPVIWTGDILCVTPCEELRRVRPGKVYVVATEDDLYVKQVAAITASSIILHSFNESYADLELPLSEVRQIYKVRGTLSYQRYM